MATLATRRMPVAVRVWTIGLALVAGTSALAVLLAHPPESLLQPLPSTLALGFALSEIYWVWDSGPPRNTTVGVSEVFLGFALIALDPGTALLVGVAGSVVLPGLRAVVGPLRRVRVRSPLVLVHGVAVPIVRGVVGVMVVVVLGGVLGRVGAALAGVVAMAVVDLATTGVIVHLDTGMPVRQVLGADVLVEYLAPLVVGAFGVAVGFASADHPWSWIVAAAMVALVVAISHAGIRWSWERRRSRVLLDVARSAVPTRTDSPVRDTVTDHVATGLLARRVEVTATRPEWADMAVRVGDHGWLAVADRSIPTQPFDHRDEELLGEAASVAEVVLDNADLLHRLTDEERLRSALLAAAAHDVRAPLAITLGSVDTLRVHGDVLAPRERAQLLDRAARSTQRVSRLVHDLIVLEQQHLAHGVDGGAAAPVRVTEEVVAHLPENAVGRVRIAAAGEVPDVAISPVLLERIIDNLVRNALEHTPDDERVDVRLRPAGRDRVVLAVEDRGPGVPPEQRAAVRAPFARATTTSSGYGLGLHIVSEFVDRAHGELQITDRDDGSGASFRVVLPAAAGPARTEDPARQESPSPSLDSGVG